MKCLRYLSLVIVVFVSMMLQGCGDETGGALTMTAPAIADNGNNTYKVSTTITYTPPTGKSAEGVEVNITATDLYGTVITPYTHTFTSGSNIHSLYFNVPQISGVSNYVRISASIGSMNASGGATIPALTIPALATTNSSINFVSGAAAGASQVVTFTGGTAPFVVSSSVPADISAVITTTNVSASGGGTLTIALLNTGSTTASSAIVTLTDSLGVALPITVNYFK